MIINFLKNLFSKEEVQKSCFSNVKRTAVIFKKFRESPAYAKLMVGLRGIEDVAMDALKEANPDNAKAIAVLQAYSQYSDVFEEMVNELSNEKKLEEIKKSYMKDESEGPTPLI